MELTDLTCKSACLSSGKDFAVQMINIAPSSRQKTEFLFCPFQTLGSVLHETALSLSGAIHAMSGYCQSQIK